MPTTINGPVHPSNKDCIDWSERGLIAFATHAVITVIDPWTLKRVQVLELHSSAICNLQWSPSRRFIDEGEESRLASSDIGGEIVVSDTLSAHSIARLKIPGSSVHSMCWFPWKDVSRDFILALHSQGQLVLWNTDSGTKVWSHTYSSPFSSFLLDPFDSSRLCLMGGDASLTFISDISLSAPPSSSSARVVSLSSTPSTLQSVSFHRAYRNIVFAVSENTLHMIDCEFGVILSRRSLNSPSLCILPSTTRDSLFIVHTNGSLSLRIGCIPNGDMGDFSSEELCCVDGGRQGGAQKRPVAAVSCPSTNAALAVLHANGRVSIWQLECSSMYGFPYRSYTIDDVLKFEKDLQTISLGGMKLVLRCSLASLSAGASLIRPRPVSTEEGDALTGMQLAAISTQHGQIHIVDLFSARILREIHAQNSPIKCIEWAGPHSILSTGYNHTLSSSNLVRNDLFLTHILTGTSRRIRAEKDESPLVLMRLSHYNCYMALSFQSDPLEIWDLKSLRLLRRMSKTCPIIVDMAWSSKHHALKQTETISVYRENLVVLDSENRLYHIVVKGLHVRDGKEVNTQWRGGGWQLRCMAWKEDLLSLGDADGRVVMWDLARRKSTQARHCKSSCVRMNFSRVGHDFTLVVLHPREVVVWDAERMVVQNSVSLDPHKSVLDAELCGLTLFSICSDNCVRVASSSDVNRPLPIEDIPFLLRRSMEDELSGIWENRVSCPISRGLLSSLKILSTRLDSQSSIAREPAFQRFMGNMSSWSLLCILHSSNTHNQLAPNLELFWPSIQLKLRRCSLCRVVCRISSCLSCIEECVVQGGKSIETAVDTLVSSSNDLLLSSLKAALLVSHHESEHCRSLIKLIATNLIASDEMSDGVQLLFLVGAGSDACKYLQSQRLWLKSVRYAKLGLNESAAVEVIAKWMIHLQMDEKSQCILGLASECKWKRVLSLVQTLQLPRLSSIIKEYSNEKDNEIP